MTSEPNPYAPPVEGPAAEPRFEDRGSPDHELSLLDAQKTQWLVAVWPDRLRLLPLDGRAPRTLDRRAFVEEATLHLTMLQRSLVLRGPKVRLELESRDLSVLRTWLGPALPDHFARSLARRRPLEIAGTAGFIIFVGLGIPWGSVDVPRLALGLGWLGCVVAAWLKPRPAVLLAECAVWALIAAGVVLDVLRGAWPPLLAFLVAVARSIAGNVDEYRFYAPMPKR